MIVIPP